MTITYKIAMAAAQDAGNRHMRLAGRKAWNAADYRYASAEYARLMGTAS